MMTPRDLSWISMSLHDLAWGRLRDAWVLACAASLRLAFPSVSLCPRPLSTVRRWGLLDCGCLRGRGLTLGLTSVTKS